MSFCVAIQSFVFYLASCTPCRQARYVKKSQARAKEERKEKERLRAEHPETYQHPDPFNTNPYWSEEILMGPHIEVRKYHSRKNISRQGLNSAGNDSQTGTRNTATAGSMNPGSSPTVVPEDGTLSLTTSVSEDWNKKRYQREDEELWGHEFSKAGHRLMDAIKQAGSSAHRRIEASLGMEPKHITEEDREEFYFAPKNPPVNDYHPPIVRQRPAHKDGHKWMLQPPPAAKIMEGKIPVSRNGSMASHMSRQTTASDNPTLGRQVHEKAMDAKPKNGEPSTELDSASPRSRPGSRKAKRRSWQSGGSSSRSGESSDASNDLAKRKMRRRSRPSMTPGGESSDEDDEFYQLKTTEPASKSPRAARRPNLQTITSSRTSDNDSPGTPPPTKTAGDLQTPRSSATSPFEDILNVLPSSPEGSAQDNNTASNDEVPPKPAAAHLRSESMI